MHHTHKSHTHTHVVPQFSSLTHTRVISPSLRCLTQEASKNIVCVKTELTTKIDVTHKSFELAESNLKTECSEMKEELGEDINTAKQELTSALERQEAQLQRVQIDVASVCSTAEELLARYTLSLFSPRA